MKILMLTAAMVSFAFFQQNAALLSKKADKTMVNTGQKQKPVSKDSRLNASYKDNTQKGKSGSVNPKSGPLNRPAKQNSGAPEN